MTRKEQIQLKAYKKETEVAIQRHINNQCKLLGYDNENSISKYLVEGNPFYKECQQISLWIGNVWVYTHNTENDVINGLREKPEISELISELPKYNSN